MCATQTYGYFFSEVCVVHNISEREFFNLESVVTHNSNSHVIWADIERVGDTAYEFPHDLEVRFAHRR